MGKLKRRLLFGDLYNIQAYEEYFAEMSRQGLHLEKVGSIFMHFKEGDPEDLNYRIDMFKKDGKEAKIQVHKENAWKFICDKEPFLVFSSKESSGLEELYKTPEDHRLALKEVIKKSLASNFAGALMTIITILILIAGIYMQLKIYRGFFFFLTDGRFLMVIIPILISLFRLIRQRWHVNRVMKILKSGEFLSHYGNHFLGKVAFALRNFAFGLFVAIVFYQAITSGNVNIYENEAMEDFSVIRLADIERENHDYSLDSQASLYKSWSLLVPKGYELWESAEIIEDSGDPYEVTLYAEYYLGRFDIITKGLEGEILHREEKYKLKFNKLFEKDDIVCYGAEEGRRKVVVCRKGLEVVFVRYYDGIVSLDEIMQATIKKLEK